MLHPEGFDLLAFDARNYGTSEADDYASLPKFSDDLRAAVDHLGMLRSTPANGVGVVGLSIGGSAAIVAAARDTRIAAVLAVGAFAHPGDPRATPGRFWWLLAPGLPLAFAVIQSRLGVRFDSIALANVISRSSASFLLVHGTDDAVVPVSHARRIASAAGSSAELWIIPGRGHSDPHLDPAMRLRAPAFFSEALGRTSSGSPPPTAF